MRAALAVAVVVTSCLAVRAARAQEPGAGEARAQFVAGLRAAEAQRWDRALGHFRRSYAIRATGAALYNMATTLRALGRHLEARDALTLLLRRDDVEADVRVAAEQMLAEESARLATLVLVSLPSASVTIRVDGTRRSDTGERPLPLETDAGERRLSVAREGHEPFFWTGTLAEGERRELAVTLEPTAAAAGTWYESPWLYVAGGVVLAAAVAVVILAAGGGGQLEPRTDRVLRP